MGVSESIDFDLKASGESKKYFFCAMNSGSANFSP
tara:strand:- start:940 stop:1044 length:105 start_codon:yes stop_codon:yes gene_type:complete